MKPPSRRVLFVLSGATVGVLAAGTAYAAMPAPAQPALVACMNNTTGVVRMVDTARGRSCSPRGETPLPAAPAGGAPSTAVPESAIRDAVDRAVERALARAGAPRGGAGGVASLDELEGLPCNVGAPDEGVVRIRYGRPAAGSPITMTCLSDSTVTTTPTPPPPSTSQPPPSSTVPVEPPVGPPVGPPPGDPSPPWGPSTAPSEQPPAPPLEPAEPMPTSNPAPAPV